MRITVLGATGGIGRAITHELAARGHQVVAASRTVHSHDWPDGVSPRPTDLRDPDAATAACADAQVVVMAAQVPYTGWARELGPMIDTAADAASAAGARLVMVDNLYAYGAPTTPISDASVEAATTRKGQLRGAIAARLLARHHRGETAVSIGRFSDYYGPHGANSLVQQVMIAPALAGKRVRAYIDADQPHTFAYLPDAARSFATLIEDERADGRSWILPAAPAVTQRELIGVLGEVLGRDLRVGTITRPMLWLAGLVDARLREARETVEQFDRPWITDASDFTGVFGEPALTSHHDALAATVAASRATTAVAA